MLEAIVIPLCIYIVVKIIFIPDEYKRAQERAEIDRKIKEKYNV